MKQIGEKLSILDCTVEMYLGKIKLKRDLKKAEFVNYSLANGLVDYISRPVLSGDFLVELG